MTVIKLKKLAINVTVNYLVESNSKGYAYRQEKLKNLCIHNFMN
jgi:hypothetical protein